MPRRTDERRPFQHRERQHRDYTCSQLRAIEKRLTSLTKEAVKLFRSIPDTHFDSTMFRQLFFMNMFWKSTVGSRATRRYLNDLSHGEYMNVYHKYWLFPAMLQHDGCWIAEDEADKSLHPEWKRRFISSYVKVIREVREFFGRTREDGDFYRSKVYSFVLTTHSPFLLSDLPHTHVVMLKKEGAKRSVAARMDANTFAGNIGQMFYNNFFMTETIGEFAKEKIQEMLDALHAPITRAQEARYAALCRCVGDDILQRLLVDRLAQAEVKENEED